MYNVHSHAIHFPFLVAVDFTASVCGRIADKPFDVIELNYVMDAIVFCVLLFLLHHPFSFFGAILLFL